MSLSQRSNLWWTLIVMMGVAQLCYGETVMLDHTLPARNYLHGTDGYCRILIRQMIHEPKIGDSAGDRSIRVQLSFDQHNPVRGEPIFDHDYDGSTGIRRRDSQTETTLFAGADPGRFKVVINDNFLITAKGRWGLKGGLKSFSDTINVNFLPPIVKADIYVRLVDRRGQLIVASEMPQP